MADLDKKIPSPVEVKDIFKYTYLFYTKWKDLSNPDDWVKVAQEMRDINQIYDCDLCQQILLELVKCIESEFKSKEVKIVGIHEKPN